MHGKEKLEKKKLKPKSGKNLRPMLIPGFGG